MPFNNVPVRNPGRYFEQFVKVVQPRSGGGQVVGQCPANPAIAFSGFSGSQQSSGFSGSQQNPGFPGNSIEAPRDQQRFQAGN